LKESAPHTDVLATNGLAETCMQTVGTPSISSTEQAVHAHQIMMAMLKDIHRKLQP
jgi:hypothetical protein